MIPTSEVPQAARILILGYNFWKTFRIPLMIQGMHNFKQLATGDIAQRTDFSRSFELGVLLIESLPAFKGADPDESFQFKNCQNQG